MTEIPNSEFLNANSWSLTTETDPATAYGYGPGDVTNANGDGRIVMGLVLSRQNDPTTLLNMDWADRQKALSALNANGTLWSTYGADPTIYNMIATDLQSEGINPLGSAQGYTSSPASRTIWIDVNAKQFKQVFGTTPQAGGNGSTLFWDGTLSTPNAWNLPGTDQSAITGLWLDENEFPIIQNVRVGGAVTLPQGAQSPGNAVTQADGLTPPQVAQLYNLPLQDPSIVTDTAAVMEPVVGDAIPSENVPGYSTFQQAFEAYRAQLGIDDATTPFDYYLGSNGGTKPGGDQGERNLDVGILTSINPNATLGLYVGSDNENSTSYSAFQSAIFDLDHMPGVLSSSFGDTFSPAPNSPFLNAYRELFADAALRNLTIYQAANDGGSSNGFSNGLTNVEQAEVSPYIVMVGGTSLSIPSVAEADPTLADIVAKAAAGDLATLYMLTETGLTSLPRNAAALSSYIETAWNQIVLTGTAFADGAGYFDATSGAGGVDITSTEPDYQQAYGLQPIDAGTNESGRAMPDVSAGAGGNITYLTPPVDLEPISFDEPGGYGTSAATPLWASLGLQIQTIFEDQGLPRPGYINDLLYTAAVVAPASFNDITLGNNVTSMNSGGPITSHKMNFLAPAGDQNQLTPTGLGYQAGTGYDLVTGLGSPNGLLLARALTAIAHAQMWSDAPATLDNDASGSWTGSKSEALIMQPTYAAGGLTTVTSGSETTAIVSGSSAAYAWSDRFAEQTLQPDFSPDLVTLFDGQSHGMAFQADVSAARPFNVISDGGATQTPQEALSDPYGFVDFDSASGSVRAARSVAVAQTADGADDQTAIVRIRQDGTYSDSVLFYRVDDYSGTINGISPGDPGYAAAAFLRAYQAPDGSTWIKGPGYGQYGETTIGGVNAGDLIAMEMRANTGTTTNTFYAFAEGNETVGGVHVGHLWNYGMNTWGWEDMMGGGDRDYNDLMVQLDFTSSSGRHLLA